MKKLVALGRGCSAHIYNRGRSLSAQVRIQQGSRWRIVKRMDTTAGTSRMKILTECVTTVRITQHMTVYSHHSSEKTDSSCAVLLQAAMLPAMIMAGIITKRADIITINRKSLHGAVVAVTTPSARKESLSQKAERLYNKRQNNCQREVHVCEANTMLITQ